MVYEAKNDWKEPAGHRLRFEGSANIRPTRLPEKELPWVIYCRAVPLPPVPEKP